MNKSTSFTKNKKSGLLAINTPKAPKPITLNHVGEVVGSGVRKTTDGLVTGVFVGRLLGGMAVKGAGKAVKTVGKVVNKVSLDFFAGVKEGMKEKEDQ